MREEHEDVDREAKVNEDVTAVNIEDINPFLVDDPDDPISDTEQDAERASSPPLAMQDSVELASSSNTLQAPLPTMGSSTAATAPQIQSLSTPSVSEDTDASIESSTPELHTPALTVTSLFLPIPQVRAFFLFNPLSKLTKAIDACETLGEYSQTR